MLMKNVFILFFLLVVILHNLFAEIKNGYERDIQQIKISLQALKDLLAGDQDLTAGEKRKMKANIRTMMDYLACHIVTEALLDKFKDISPDLYQEIDTLKDSKGRSVDVYVKFLPSDKAPFKIPGMLAFYPSGADSHNCMSEYGMGSVSVRVLISSSSLLILSHEFGHLKYIVPNLSSYFRFYKRVHSASSASDSFGHSAGDLSGLNALRFEKRFRLNYFHYRKVDSNEFVPPLALLVRSRRNIIESHNTPALAMGGWAGPGYGTHDGRLP
jgi:hypothetical protein